MIEKHDLIHDFPEHRKRIHDLKLSNRHFSRLFDEYHEIDHEIRRIELDIEPKPDRYLEDKKKKRLRIKDELFNIISAMYNSGS